MTGYDEILAFWLDEIGPEGWYAGTDAVDRACRERFLDCWRDLSGGGFKDWLTNARGGLAYVVVADQFPRNIHRGTGKSFATDPLARKAAATALDHGWDLEIAGLARQFFYMPFVHSENDEDQARAVNLFRARLPEGSENLFHARAHQRIIREFGRFPFRNKALGRDNTPAEEAFMQAGAYREFVRRMRAEEQAS